MGLIELIILIAIVGLIVWMVTTLIPMPPEFQRIIIVLAIVGVLFYILRMYGLMPSFK